MAFTKMPTAAQLLLLLLFSTAFAAVFSDLASDRAALLGLRSAVGRNLKWNVSDSSPCTWAGVNCTAGRVSQLRLPGVSLMGTLPAGTVGNLTALRTLSLRFNRLSGALPPDLGAITGLRNLYLQGNRFSGEIPDFIFTLTNLVRLNLASNNFSGGISPSFNNLTRLGTLFLENNQLSGSLPDLNLTSLGQFNVSNNHLNGSIPAGLRDKQADSFIGNTLCGGPLSPCVGSGTAGGDGGDGGGSGGKKHHKGLSGGAIAGIVVAAVVVFLLLLLVLFFCCCRSKSSPKTQAVDLAAVAKPPDAEAAGVSAGDKSVPPNGTHNVAAAAVPAAAPAPKAAVSDVGAKKLIFFGSAAKAFDLEDLLRASAEVLGKGTFGTAYKAVLEMGTTVAVKRLRDVTIPEREFREKVEAVGGMDHENLVPLRAYYFSKDEKLLVYDYLPNGSLSALLHGKSSLQFSFFSASIIDCCCYVVLKWK